MHLSRKLLLKFLAEHTYLESMNNLLSQVMASVSSDVIRIPDPPKDLNEGDFTSLPEFVSPFLSNDKSSLWWKNALKNYSPYCWDFVSTCTINGQGGLKKGLLLVEAKAKKGELVTICDQANPNIKLNESLESLYAIANSDLQKVSPLAKLSPVNCRQLSNHIYRSWFLARAGIPVILLYLGFHFPKKTNSGNRVFTSAADWKNYFLKAARKIGVNSFLNKEIYCGDSTFKMICASVGTDAESPPATKYQKYPKYYKKAQNKKVPDATDRLMKTKNERALISKKFSKKRIILNKPFNKNKFDPEKVLTVYNENLSAINSIMM